MKEYLAFGKYIHDIDGNSVHGMWVFYYFDLQPNI